MKVWKWIWIAAAPAFMAGSCTTEDPNEAGSVYTCDARATVAELCIEEPDIVNNLKTSKSTCTSAGGTWSDATVCASGYQKKCQDGDKFEYFYAKDDAGKQCSALVSAIFGSNGPVAASVR